MPPLLQTFLDIALWRKGPQDLPASRGLVLCAAALYALVAVVRVRSFDLQWQTAWQIAAIDIAMSAVWVWAVLAFFGRQQRFVQTFSAMLGVSILLGGLELIVRVVQIVLDDADLPAFWLLLRVIAIALMLGRIFKHAIERSLAMGIALTITIALCTDAAVLLLFPQLRSI